jgi:hypothetical protein
MLCKAFDLFDDKLMKSKLFVTCWLIFVFLVALFVFALTPLRQLSSLSFELFPGIPLIVAGVALVVFVAVRPVKPVLKGFMITAGVSAVGWPSSLFLHNFLYSYFPTEPVTYILFFIIFPLTFVIGALGTIITTVVLIVRHK